MHNKPFLCICYDRKIEAHCLMTTKELTETQLFQSRPTKTRTNRSTTLSRLTSLFAQPIGCEIFVRQMFPKK
ncbi:MAG: hypothetical protein CMO55_19655 [Verrucomicrobiales bacterium]|nr:hypothetical protein [Verrucomicrobiales bacterium]